MFCPGFGFSGGSRFGDVTTVVGSDVDNLLRGETVVSTEGIPGVLFPTVSLVDSVHPDDFIDGVVALDAHLVEIARMDSVIFGNVAPTFVLLAIIPAVCDGAVGLAAYDNGGADVVDGRAVLLSGTDDKVGFDAESVGEEDGSGSFERADFVLPDEGRDSDVIGAGNRRG